MLRHGDPDDPGEEDFQGNYLPSTYFSSASTDRQKKSAPGLEEMASNQAVHKGSLFFNEWSPL